MYISDFYLHELDHALDMVPENLRLAEKAILVTGATGLIGSYIVDLLLALNRKHNSNIKVYALGRNINRLKKRFDEWNDSNLLFLEHDVNEPLKCQTHFDYIIHAASYAYPAAFDKYPVDTIISNTMGTLNLLEHARRQNTKRFVFVSSGEVYGQADRPDLIFEEDYCGYVNPLDARSCYPNSKRLGETLCVAYLKQYQVSSVIVRPCHVYGPYTTRRDNRASTQFIDCVLRNEPVVLQSLGLQRRSYCYVADCATAILTAMLEGKDGAAYNIANPESIATIAELAGLIAEKAGQKVIMPQPSDLPPNMPVRNQVLCSKSIEALGWKGQYTLERGVRHTLHIRKESMKYE